MTLWGGWTGCEGWETQQNSDPSTIFVCILYCWPGVLQCLVILWGPTCKFTHEQSKTKRLQCKTRAIVVHGEEKQVHASYIESADDPQPLMYITSMQSLNAPTRPLIWWIHQVTGLYQNTQCIWHSHPQKVKCLLKNQDHLYSEPGAVNSLHIIQFCCNKMQH